jgi:hypothetical protein
MKEDPIVEETHCIRREIAAQFGGDIHAFFEHLPNASASMKARS